MMPLTVNEKAASIPEESIKQRKQRVHISKEMVDVITEFYTLGKDYKEIAELVGCNSETISVLLRRHGIRDTIKVTHLTEAQKKEIEIGYLKGVSTNELAKKYNCSIAPIYRHLTKVKLTKAQGENIRKYEVNHTYFSEIDSEDKAYFLGFMYADGYNYQQKRDKSISLHLAIKDKIVVETLRSKICPDKQLCVSERSKKNPNWQDSICLKVNSSQLSDDLAKWGCVQAKTHILTFPENLPSEYYQHFIRGYFDGDGHVSKKRFEIIGTEAFLNKVQQILMENCGLNKTKIYQRHKYKDGVIRSLIYGGSNVMRSIYDYLYKDANYYLERKKKAFEIF